MYVCLIQDKYAAISPDACHSPMQWNADKHAGFTTADHPWLPLHESYTTNNVQVRKKIAVLYYMTKQGCGTGSIDRVHMTLIDLKWY